MQGIVSHWHIVREQDFDSRKRMLNCNMDGMRPRDLKNGALRSKIAACAHPKSCCRPDPAILMA